MECSNRLCDAPGRVLEECEMKIRQSKFPKGTGEDEVTATKLFDIPESLILGGVHYTRAQTVELNVPAKNHEDVIPGKWAQTN